MKGRLFNKAIWFLAHRPHSSSEIKRKLLRTKRPSDPTPGKIEYVDKIVTELQNDGLLNDEKFASWFVDQRSLCRPRSSMMMQAELRMRGINGDAFDKAMENYDSLEACTAILQKRRRVRSNETPQELKEFLIRKGFRWDEIKEAMKREDIN